MAHPGSGPGQVHAERGAWLGTWVAAGVLGPVEVAEGTAKSAVGEEGRPFQ